MAIPSYLKRAAGWVGLTCLLAIVGGLLRPLLIDGRLPAFMPLEWAVLAAVGAAGGALGGALATREIACRAAQLSLRHGAARGASWAAMMSFAFAVVLLNPPLLSSADLALFLVMGFLQGVFQSTWGCAWYWYGLAVLKLRRGDRERARSIIRQYLKQAHEDPRWELRVPIARHFLEDDSATLDVPTEPIAADAPAGRGTELEQAEQPAGRGTELESGLREPGRGRERL